MKKLSAFKFLGFKNFNKAVKWDQVWQLHCSFKEVPCRESSKSICLFSQFYEDSRNIRSKKVIGLQAVMSIVPDKKD